MDQQLLVGVLLIIVGLAIGLIAVALVLNRRAAREEQAAQAPEQVEAAEAAQPELDHRVATASGEGPAPDMVAPPSAPPPSSESAPLSIQPSAATAAPAQRTLVAEIYRDERSGGLIVRSAGREYRALSLIEDEQLRMDLTILATDLSGRSSEGVRTTAPPSEPRTPPRPGSRSMLEGINSILQRALADAGNKAKGVQLIPDAAGGVKVLIGLKSYALDEVPDEEIRRLIRESVAEWEASQ